MRRHKKNKQNKEQSPRFPLYAAGAVFVIALVVFITTAPFGLVESKKLPVTFIVSGKSGFDLNATALSYGSLMPGSKGTRVVNVGNTFDFPIYVTFHPQKDLQGLLVYNSTRQFIPVGGNMSLSFTLDVPTDFQYGNYSSFIVVKIWK